MGEDLASQFDLCRLLIRPGLQGVFLVFRRQTAPEQPQRLPVRDLDLPKIAGRNEVKTVEEVLTSRLRDLVSLDGVSGHETQVATYVRSVVEPLADYVKTDAIGNVYAGFRIGQRNEPGQLAQRDNTQECLRLMFCAHMDEVGLMVKGIEPDGFLRFEKVGAIPDVFLPRTAVRVQKRNGVIQGVIGTRPGYLMSLPSGDLTQARELYVDIGARSADDVRALGVEIGDVIAFSTPFTGAAHGRVYAKAVDDRAGCAVLLALAEELRKACIAPNKPVEVVLVFSVQEEVGCRGATVAARALQPDYAFVIDTMPSGDTPDTSSTKDINARLGGGAVIPVMSGGIMLGDIMPRAMKETIVEAARSSNVPYQLAILPVAATDSSVIKLAANGIPVGTLGIPRRYAHSPVELVDVTDLKAVLNLSISLIRLLADGGRLI